jgi:hypothetical protein
MRQLWILVAVIACNKPGGGGEGGGGGAGGFGPKITPDWSSKKLVAQDGTIEGLAFTIQVPEGLPRDKRQGGDWESPDQKYDHAPKVFTSTIEIKRIKDLGDAKYHATLDAKAKTWVREQSTPDSWALTMAEPDKTRIEVITYTQANDTLFIKCKAVQHTDEGALPSYAKTRQMLETICDSLKPTGEAPTAPANPGGEAAAQDEGERKDEPVKVPEPEPAAADDDSKGKLQRAADD